MKVSITGHTTERLRGHEEEVKKWLNAKLDWWEQESTFGNGGNIEYALTGMAQGTDQIWADVALERGIKLWCYYPFPKKEYHPNEQRIINQADAVFYLLDKYSKGCWDKRDQWMIDESDILLAVFDGIEFGGTWRAIEYARSIGKPIIYYPKEKLMEQ